VDTSDYKSATMTLLSFVRFSRRARAERGINAFDCSGPVLSKQDQQYKALVTWVTHDIMARFGIDKHQLLNETLRK
jgi:hypothetical protein